VWYNVSMKRKTFFLPPALVARLAAESAKSGVPMSELVRRAIETELTRREAL